MAIDFKEFENKPEEMKNNIKDENDYTKDFSSKEKSNKSDLSYMTEDENI